MGSLLPTVVDNLHPVKFFSVAYCSPVFSPSANISTQASELTSLAAASGALLLFLGFDLIGNSQVKNKIIPAVAAICAIFTLFILWGAVSRAYAPSSSLIESSLPHDLSDCLVSKEDRIRHRTRKRPLSVGLETIRGHISNAVRIQYNLALQLNTTSEDCNVRGEN